MNEVLITRNLVKRYRGHRALDGFTLAVPAFSILGLVGRNGAGKTTWMMTVAGFVRPNAGEINLLGKGPFDANVHSGRLTILPQDSELPLDGRPRDLLIRYARLQGLSAFAAKKNADELLAAFNLTDKARAPIRSLSHGMRKRVMVAQAFIGDPEIVLLDEPLSGLDPVEQERMRAFILARRGRMTMVISSHQLEDIEKLCTHVAFVAAGKVERIESLAQLTSDSGRLVFCLRRKPEDFAALESALPGAQFVWDEFASALTVDFDPAKPPEDANAVLAPLLLPLGLVSIAAGRTLEQAYLQK